MVRSALKLGVCSIRTSIDRDAQSMVCRRSRNGKHVFSQIRLFPSQATKIITQSGYRSSINCIVWCVM